MITLSLLQEVALDVSKDSGAPNEDDADADGPPAAACEYGVCMVDATTATFSLGQFADDPARSRLRTLLAQQLPVEIVMEKVRPARNISNMRMPSFRAHHCAWRLSSPCIGCRQSGGLSTRF